MLLPHKPMHVPATPVVESCDIRVLYDVEHATLLGKGGFSQVVAVRHRPTNTMRALKVIKKMMLKGKVSEMVIHEQEILRRTSHPNIIQLHECITTPHHIYFSLDLMGGDLFELIVRNHFIPEGAAREIMYQILCGIDYLHGQCIVHRDIKPENILLNIVNPTGNAGSSERKSGEFTEAEWDKSLNIEVKLADFGLAKLVQEWDVQSTPCGTSFYIAPEVIRGIEAQGTKPLCTTQKLVKSVDVWSAGIVLFVMLSGRPPFHGQVTTSEERRQLLRRINRGVLFDPKEGWEGVSEEAKDLIIRMLEQDSTKRLTAMQALRHPFFTLHGYMPPVLGGMNSPLSPKLPQQKKWQAQKQEGEKVGKQTKEGTVEEALTSQMSEEQVEQGWKSATLPNQTVMKKRRKFFDIFRTKSPVGSRKEKDATTEGQKPLSPDNVDVETVEEEEHRRDMQAEIDALQKDIVETGDKEGDNTSYKQTIPLVPASQATRQAVMNANAKVGPAALKK
ncbi:protein kinase, putative [Trypanosoma cruzi marinkellei]|uniref:Protein kinase, putative n=1 Tax=Trypanosoma cruzi marinkellei TaxID=85056 RepID=K2MAU4_TRYCR|nr:protein kinase, putative [Trypanosoma cruzi marinkellei]